uniref:Reverse transcriptase domain-containing protein n=1 Tax=Leptobrachium leishanense TaxID=445787 RepID=A0A8C5Q3U3_9ANUR
MASKEKIRKRGRRGGRLRLHQNLREKRKVLDQTGIYNLSTKVLTEAQIKVLKKGLKYAPTRNIDKFETYVDLQNFKKNLCLKKYFLRNPLARTAPIEIYQHTKLKEKSNFYPRSMLSNEINAFEQVVLKEIEGLKWSKNSSNLTKREYLALKELNQDNDIIIKPADKGGGLVIMTKQFYEEEALRILKDERTYQTLNHDPTLRMKKLFTEYLNEGRDMGILNNKEYEYLTPEYPIMPIFYFLPKIHKNVEKPPGRPIISGIGSISSKISEYIDILLQPLVLETEAYLKDTINLLQILGNVEWHDDYTLITSDVKSLYSIIPHERGCEAVKYFLNKSGTILEEQSDFILKGIKLILENNFFNFNDTFYIQKEGTAMGTKFAPCFANLYMSYYEKSWREKWKENIVIYRRYIDDLLIIWKGEEDSLKEFLNCINTNDWNIDLDSHYSKTQVNFLDLTVYVENGKIETKTFFKQVDTNCFIEKNSCHFEKWLEGVPKSQLLRIHRNCTKQEVFQEQSNYLMKNLEDKGYTRHSLEETREEINNKERKELIKYKPKVNQYFKEGEVPFIFTYNQQNWRIRSILKKHWPLLLKDPLLKEILPEKPTIICRGAQNLKKKLIKSHYTSRKKNNNMFGISKAFHRCGNCRNCRETGNKKEAIKTFNGEKITYTIKEIITCFSRNIIYLLICPCGLKYVGRTTRHLNKRLYEHIRNIKIGYEKHSVSQHFKIKHNSDPHIYRH